MQRLKVASTNFGFVLDCDELIEKYGQGETDIVRCDNCHYEQLIHSAGVHITEGGSVKVYADKDTFCCPNCDDNGSSEGAPEGINMNRWNL